MYGTQLPFHLAEKGATGTSCIIGVLRMFTPGPCSDAFYGVSISDMRYLAEAPLINA
jgi:hypothetical protein